MESVYINKSAPDKRMVFQAEYDKLQTIFSDVDEKKRQLVEGLIGDAAFLYAENKALKRILAGSGTVCINPNNPTQQRPVPAATQYLKNANSYAVIIKTLNGVLSKNEIEADDESMDDFI